MTRESNYREIRSAELELIRPLLKSGFSILELGGGDGWQASIIASWGCRVTSIDVTIPPNGQPCFPVQLYDGVTIPAPDHSFDVVFSSNVLEHVVDLQLTLREVKRVLKPNGISAHILPSVPWRFWTLVFHYPYMTWTVVQNIRYFLFGGKTDRSDLGTWVPVIDIQEKIAQRPWKRLVWYAIGLRAHGEFSTSLEELWAYRTKAWVKRFTVGGFDVTSVFKTGLYYSGIWFLLPIAWRRSLARVGGSACNVFVMNDYHAADLSFRARDVS